MLLSRVSYNRLTAILTAMIKLNNEEQKCDQCTYCQCKMQDKCGAGASLGAFGEEKECRLKARKSCG